MKVTRKASNILMGTLFLFVLFEQIHENLARPNSARRTSSSLSNKPSKRGWAQPISPPVEIDNEDVISPVKLEDSTSEDSIKDESSGTSEPSGLLPRQWLDLEQPLAPSVTAQGNGDLVLQCMAVGSPPPAIYWLKDGKPIENTAPFDTEKLQNHVLGRSWFRKQQEVPNGFSMAKTSSILPFRCIRPEDEGQYTCVADNGVKQASSTTTVSIKHDNEAAELRPECEARSSVYSYVKKGKRGVGPVVLSHETLHMEAIGNTVVLPCRVSGRPRPTVTWLDPEGKPVLVGKKFQIIHRGDLVIRKVSWGEMGEFTCVAENPLGTDSQSTFLYPLANERSS